MNYYFLYSTSTGVIVQPNKDIIVDQWTNVPVGQDVIGPFPQETASIMVQDAFNHPDQYLVQNGQLVTRPYFILTSTKTTLNEYTINATLNNPPATPPTQVVFSIVGTTFTTNVTNNQTSIIVDLDEVVAGQAITIKASTTGCIDGTVTIGGTAKPTTNMLAKTQANGNIIVKCTSKSEIKTYGDSISVAYPDRGADVANMIDLAFDGLYKLLTWAQNPTYTPINLTDDEKNAVSVIGSQYLPLMRLKFSDIAPIVGSTTTQNFRWPAVMSDKSNANPPANKILQKLADADTTQP